MGNSLEYSIILSVIFYINFMKKESVEKSYLNAIGLEPQSYLSEVRKGISTLSSKFSDYNLTRVKFGNEFSEDKGFLYIGSNSKGKEKILAYTNLDKTMLVREGDLVLISGLDEMGFVVEILKSDNFKTITFVIDWGEKYERLSDIGPSDVSLNYTLALAESDFSSEEILSTFYHL